MPDTQASELADEHGMDLHYGREDKPHVHKWRIQHDVDHAYVWCEDYWKNDEGECEMDVEEAERRLNAVEQLSAESALACWHKIEVLSRELMGYESDLLAYASALEGHDA